MRTSKANEQAILECQFESSKVLHHLVAAAREALSRASPSSQFSDPITTDRGLGISRKSDGNDLEPRANESSVGEDGQAPEAKKFEGFNQA
jgi:hypothetical protein